MENNISKIPIRILLRLFNRNVSKEKILKEFSIKETTFYKYLQYIKEAGFIVENEKNIFKIAAFCDFLNFSDIDVEFFVDILNAADDYLSFEKAKIFKKYFMKSLKFSNLETFEKIKNKYENLKNKNTKQSKIDLFNKYISSGKTLNIITKDEKKLLIKPKNLVYKKNSVCLNFFNKKDKINQMLPLESILKINVVSDSDVYIENPKETIFELNGKLAMSYILKENERIIDKIDNKIVIANSDGNKNYLFKRLLRYDIFCKVLFPKKDVEDFKIFIKNSIESITKC